MDDRLPPQLSEGHLNDGTHLFPLNEQQMNSSPIAQSLIAIGGGLTDLGNAVIAEFGKGLWEGIKAAGEGIKEAIVGKDVKPEPQKESLGKALSETIKAAVDGAKEGIRQSNEKTKEPVNTKDLKERLISQARQQERQKTAKEAAKVERESSASPAKAAIMRSPENSHPERTR
ncbi:hypothetical protein D521_0462 [beta proteobacterium CB]|nr:hypothetical protein D521_0462 [beta proteobacterium CB]